MTAPGASGAGRTRRGDAGPGREADASLAAHWAALVSAALLGTDRRPPPPPPPGVLADLVVGAEGPTRGHAGGEPGSPPDSHSGGEPGSPPDEPTAVLEQVAALTAMRRAGIRPGPAPPPLAPCPPDDRPVCPPVAARRLAELLEAWPVLVDEWLRRLQASGHRLPPEHVVGLLGRYRTDPARRARVVQAGGPVAAWIVDLFPEQLAARGAARRSGTRPDAATEATETPGGAAGLELSPDLAPLLGCGAGELADALVDGLDRGRWVLRHRPLLVALVCQVDPGTLGEVADRLAADVRSPAAVFLASELADLARTRAGMLAELAPVAGAVAEAEARRHHTDAPEDRP